MARIMIVEDDHTDHLLLYSIFEGSGHEIHMARDGEHAIKTFLKRDIHVVITDGVGAWLRV